MNFKMNQEQRKKYLKVICDGSHLKEGAVFLLDLEGFTKEEINEATKTLGSHPGNIAQALYNDGYSLEDIFFKMDMVNVSKERMSRMIEMFQNSHLYHLSEVDQYSDVKCSHLLSENITGEASGI